MNTAQEYNIFRFGTGLITKEEIQMADEENFSVPIFPFLNIGYPTCIARWCSACKAECQAKGLKWSRGGKECFNKCKAERFNQVTTGSTEDVGSIDIQSILAEQGVQQPESNNNTMLYLFGGIGIIVLIVVLFILLRK